MNSIDGRAPKFRSRVPPLLLACAASLLLTAASQTPMAPPKTLRLEVEVVSWRKSPPWQATHRIYTKPDTRILAVRTGDDLVDTTLYHMGIWTGGPHRLSPLTLGPIVGPERCWVRITQGGCCALVPTLDVFQDSILVSTAWRSFDTRSVDGGDEVRVRVVSSAAALPTGSAEVLKVRSGWCEPESQLGQALRSTEVAGIFRLEWVAREDSSGAADPMRRSVLGVRAEQAWLGSGISVGDTLSAWVAGGIVTDTTWAPQRGATPMRVGRPVILFLSRAASGSPDKWSFKLYSGYALFDDAMTRVFHYPIRGEPIEQFRHRVEWDAWRSRHPLEGRVFGNLFADESGAPIAGARVELVGWKAVSMTDSTGWFALIGVPIGRHILRVTAGCGPVAGFVDATDEYVDTLEVRMPCDSGVAPSKH